MHKGFNAAVTQNISPKENDHAKDLKSPSSYCTPPNLASGISVTSISLETRLRRSAMTYKNTPAIIRKRSSAKRVKVNQDVENTAADSSSEKLGCLTNLRKQDASAAVRCLEHAFNMEIH